MGFKNIPMANNNILSVVFFVLLGLGICSATRALLTLEGGVGYTQGSGGTGGYGARHGVGSSGGAGCGGSGGGCYDGGGDS